MAEVMRLGGFHEMPDGSISRSTGWNGDDRTVLFYLDDGAGTRTATEDEFWSWKPRPDLSDFPNARDPLLPYRFDLFWDIKTLSQLKFVIEEGEHEDMSAILAATAEEGIDVGLDIASAPSVPRM
jgi:hypothetical protein|nr:hypothetical protein [Neorhizobium tomejilense]